MKTNWTQVRMERLFARYNRRYWDGRLPSYAVAPERLDGCVGLCDSKARKITVDVDAHRSDAEVRSTVLHEMAHVADTSRNRVSHGRAVPALIGQSLVAAGVSVALVVASLGCGRPSVEWCISGGATYCVDRCNSDPSFCELCYQDDCRSTVGFCDAYYRGFCHRAYKTREWLKWTAHTAGLGALSLLLGGAVFICKDNEDWSCWPDTPPNLLPDKPW